MDVGAYIRTLNIVTNIISIASATPKKPSLDYLTGTLVRRMRQLSMPVGQSNSPNDPNDLNDPKASICYHAIP